jgi:hypothetical protein
MELVVAVQLESSTSPAAAPPRIVAIDVWKGSTRVAQLQAEAPPPDGGQAGATGTQCATAAIANGDDVVTVATLSIPGGSEAELRAPSTVVATVY